MIIFTTQFLHNRTSTLPKYNPIEYQFYTARLHTTGSYPARIQADVTIGTWPVTIRLTVSLTLSLAAPRARSALCHTTMNIDFNCRLIQHTHISPDKARKGVIYPLQ